MIWGYPHFRKPPIRSTRVDSLSLTTIIWVFYVFWWGALLCLVVQVGLPFLGLALHGIPLGSSQFFVDSQNYNTKMARFGGPLAGTWRAMFGHILIAEMCESYGIDSTSSIPKTTDSPRMEGVVLKLAKGCQRQIVGPESDKKLPRFTHFHPLPP